MIGRILVLTLVASFTISCGPREHSISYVRTGNRIELVGEISFEGPLEMEIRSQRNHRVSRLSDRVPGDQPAPGSPASGREIWFPVVDIELSPDLEAVAEFDGVSTFDRASWNGNFWRNSVPLRPRNVFSDKIEHWENGLYVESSTAELREFYLRKTIPDGAGQWPAFRSLTDDWAGNVRLFRTSGGDREEVASLEISLPTREACAPVSGDSEKEVTDAILADIEFLLRCRNVNPRSPTFGGLYLFYDLDARTFRRSDWVWTWGPAIRFLIDASKVPEVARRYGEEKLLAVAREIGDASLRFFVEDPESPADGLLITRFDPTVRYPHGYSGFAGPADAFFLAGWGYLPLFEATGDRRFLDASVRLVNQTERLLAQDPVIEQDFVFGSGKWKNWTMDESGFGMEAFAEVFRVTQDPAYRELGRRYLASLTSVLARGDGLWDRTWHRKDPTREDDSWPIEGPDGIPIRVPTNANTRGLSWAMMGLLAADRLLPGEGHLDQANRMAKHLMDAQHPDGHWNFLYDRPESEVGISEKGTAIFSALFYRLYQKTRHAEHLETARKALYWCLQHRVSESQDGLACGGIVGRTPASGVVYRRWYPLICTYTMSFYGNALLAELGTKREDLSP